MNNIMITIVASILGFVLIAALGFAFTGVESTSARTAKRTQTIAKSRSRETGGLKGEALTAEQRRAQLMKSLRDQEKNAKKQNVSIGARLQHAGITGSPKAYWGICIVAGILFALGALFARQSPIIILCAGLGGGFGLPFWILGALGTRRAKKFTAAFPDAMDIIVRGVKSGMPLRECLRIIGSESPEPLGGEFKRMTEALSMGVSIEQSLERMYSYIPTQEVRFLAIVLAIQSKTGGNLAEALGNLSAVIRARKMMREKVNALAGEAVASASIIGSLPIVVTLLISVVSPAYMAPMYGDPRGHTMLAIGGGVMVFGIFVMRKMINFKI